MNNMITSKTMTALPNHTCYEVLESFGVELPYEVAMVDIVKFNLQDATRYSRYGVLVNGRYNSYLVKLAELSGSWKKVGMAKSDAYHKAHLIDVKINRFLVVQNQLKNCSKDLVFKLIEEYNSIISFFKSYGISIAKEIEWDFKSNSIRLKR